MIKNALAVCCILFSFCCTFAQRPVYDINVKLNHRERSLDGSLKVLYTNNTADTVKYLWFNIYPNAFKSDRTAFSEYLLSKRRTDFYFSSPQQRGYINRLNFRAGESILLTEDHPEYLDVIKVFLKEPLAPGDRVTITTPFHVKVPNNFDGIGYASFQYDLKYWYPAIASDVRPFTVVDSTSNEPSDYTLSFTFPAKYNFIVSNRSQSTSSHSLSDSLTETVVSFSNVNDLPIKIVLPHASPKSSTNKLPTLFDSSFKSKITKFLSKPILPAVGYNAYDGFQLGVLSHNFKPEQKFHYYVAPVYTFKSKSVAGIAGASYTFRPAKFAEEIKVGFSSTTFSYDDGIDSLGDDVFAKLFKVAPYISVRLPTSKPDISKTLSFKSYIINERDLKFVRSAGDPFFYPSKGEYATRFVNELSFDYASDRVLYPYHAQLQVQQGLTFYRVNATGNYFFNYPKGGGASVRLFAAKFGYIGSLSSSEKFAAARYQPKLTAVRGGEDYTYSNYFVGRNDFDGLGSQQMMMRDGGLKLRTDLFEGLQGRSDNWIAAVNVSTTLPDIFPVRLPVKIFFDAGTYSEAWDPDNVDPRFLYVSGLQLSLFKNVLNIYAPILYSKQFRDRLKSVPEENSFGKRLSFSLDFSVIEKLIQRRH